MEYTVHEKSKKDAAYSRISYEKKKVRSLQNIIKMLKEKNELNAAEYMMVRLQNTTR